LQSLGSAITLLQRLTYTYYPKGNITLLVDWANDITRTYTYEAFDRLLSATGEALTNIPKRATMAALVTLAANPISVTRPPIAQPDGKDVLR
jgi:hypothetical protein